MKVIKLILLILITNPLYAKYFWLGDTIKLLPHEERLAKHYSFEEAYATGRELKVKGHYSEAVSFFKIALAKNPYDTQSNFELGDVYHALGDLPKGYLGSLARWILKDEFKERLWRGEPLKNKSILVQAQWGFGDTFQYMRYLELLKNEEAFVIFNVQEPLVHLATLCPYIDQVIVDRDISKADITKKKVYFDYQIPLTGLPYIFNTTLSTIPCKIPYIYAHKVLVKAWQKVLEKDKNFKIGICWQGAFRGDPQTHKRTIPLTKLSVLFPLPEVSIYSLQQKDGQAAIESFEYKKELHVFESQFDVVHGSFMDTAAVMKNLDLVITIDTSIAHLAGALGVEVWILLPFAAECRFLTHRTDSPWYPTMRLFRAPRENDWDSIIKQVKEELIKMINHNNR